MNDLKAPDHNRLFDLLEKAMQGGSLSRTMSAGERAQKTVEISMRINAHIRAKTGHNTLINYHHNGGSPEEKRALYRECLNAIIHNELDQLEGGGNPDPETSPAPEREAEGPRPSGVPEAPDQPESAEAPAPASLSPDTTAALQSAFGTILAAIGHKSPSVDEARVRTLALEVLTRQLDQQWPVLVKQVAELKSDLKTELLVLAEEIRKNLPPRDAVEIRKWDGSVGEVKGQHRQFGTILRYVTSRRANNGFPVPTYLYGSPGGGKTHMAFGIAEALGIGDRLTIWACSPTDTGSKIVGFRNMATGDYVPGIARRPYEHGGLLFVDEVDLSDPTLMASCNTLIENDRFTFPDGATVKRHPDFYLVVGANTIGKGGTGGFGHSRNKLDPATRSRFAFIRLEYDIELETRICGNPKWAEYVVKVRQYVETHCNESVYITPRASINGAALLANGVSPEQVADSVLFTDFSPDQKTSILASVGSFNP